MSVLMVIKVQLCGCTAMFLEALEHLSQLLQMLIYVFLQVSISARHHTSVKERNHWMDFTGLGTTSSTTGGCLSAVIIFL